ncbi:hypothetical protein [Leucobacter sp.]
MSAAPSDARRPSTLDRIGIVLFMLAGAAIIVVSAIRAGGRIMQVLLGEDVPVTASFPGTPVEAPIGPGGSAVRVQLETAVLELRQMSPLGFWSGILEQVVYFGSLATVVVCLVLLSRNILRGRVFSRGSTALVATAGIAGLAGACLVPLFRGLMGAEALLSVVGDQHDGFIIATFEPFSLVILAFVVAVVATAYAVGARIQRDTEGLV